MRIIVLTPVWVEHLFRASILIDERHGLLFARNPVGQGAAHGIGGVAGFGGEREGATMELDPICGKRVEPRQSALSVEHKKRRYYFCSESCKQIFQREAEKARLHELARVGALMSKGRVRWGLA